MLEFRPFNIRIAVRWTDGTAPSSAIHALWRSAFNPETPFLCLLCLQEGGSVENQVIRFWRSNEGYILESHVTKDKSAEEVFNGLKSELESLGWEVTSAP